MRNLKTSVAGVRLALGLCASLSLVSCSLKSADDGASLYVDLSALKSERARFGLLSSGGSLFNLVAPPTSASGFSCYAVNVTGPGIGDSSMNPNTGDLGFKFSQLVNGQTYCSYRGVVSPPIFLDANSNADAVLQIPPAGIRLVQLVGVNDAAICASGVIDDQTGSNNSSSGNFFEVGRAVVNDVFGDRSVNVVMDWPTNTLSQLDRAMDCGNGCGTISSISPESGGTSEASLTSAVEKFAFKIPTVAGKRIQTITIPIRASVAALTATMTLYSGPVGSGISGGSPVTATTHYEDIPVAVTANASLEEFNLVDMSVGDGYLQMVSGMEYWAVVTSTATGGSSLNITFNLSGSANPDIQRYASSVWNTLTSSGVPHQIVGCSN